MLAVAQSYVASGLSVFPGAPREKEPAFNLLPRVYDAAEDKTKSTWKPYQDRLPNQGELRHWFADSNANIAIVCGAVSGGLVVLDIESLELYERWRELAAHLVDEATLAALPVVASGKGRHVYFRMDAPPGNRRLAVRGRELLAENRGEGGCITAPPSIHPSGKVYELLNGDLRAIPKLDLGTAEALFDATRALAPVQEHPAQPAKAEGGRPAREGDSVIDTYNNRHQIEEVLEAHGYTRDRAGRYIRPGGERSSIFILEGRSIHYNPADPLYSEAPGGGNHAHTPFSAFCTLDHAGDVRAAVRAAAHELGMAHNTAEGNRAPSKEQLAQAGRALGMGEGAGDTWPYFVHEGGLWMHQQHSDGAPKPPLLLGNFTAEITAERVLNDGEQREELYTVAASCQGRRRTIELKRTDFENEAALARNRRRSRRASTPEPAGAASLRPRRDQGTLLECS